MGEDLFSQLPLFGADPKPVRAKEPPVEATPAAKLKISSQQKLTIRESSIVRETLTRTEVEVVPTPPTETAPKIISVGQLNQAIRGLLEGEFPLIWLKGEISNFKPHSSGHFYFNLKDSKAQISAVMFRGFNAHLRFKPQDGMEVVVRGKITVYEPRGNYQIFVELMEPLGQGALQLAFEQLKKKLAAEGLFAPERKRPLPVMPRKVALVTSPTGAAIRDMLTVLSRRFKGLEITIFPTSVQGVQAPAEIVAAIELANRIGDFDVMIVGRGGGSIEDLWSFNEEKVARALAASRIPTVSAVGHEIDFTIADFVADVRAPTPSAAAEMIVKNAADIADRVRVLVRHLRMSVGKRLGLVRAEVKTLTKGLIDPQRRLQDLTLRADELETRLETNMQRYLADRRVRLERLFERMGTPQTRLRFCQNHLLSLQTALQHAMRAVLIQRGSTLREHAAVLDSLSPLRTVARGYSIVTNEKK